MSQGDIKTGDEGKLGNVRSCRYVRVSVHMVNF